MDVFKHHEPTQEPSPEPAPGDDDPSPETFGNTGQIFLWVGFAAMAVSTFSFYLIAQRVNVELRRFHNLTFMITGIASMAYLTMAFDLGSVMVGHREFLYARYIDWMITTPLLLLDLCLLAGVHWNEIIFLIGADILMIAAGVVGALMDGNGKWAFFIYSCIFFGFIVVSLFSGMSAQAERYGAEVRDKFQQLSILTVALWTAYPVIWVLAEGTHIIPVDLEILLYAVLDIIAKCGFGFLLLANDTIIEKVESGNNSLLASS
eukprot:Clim_evm46s77 gene=Clim_evmTU46s77